MADETHLSLLRQGVEVWNEWRRGYRDEVDLSRAWNGWQTGYRDEVDLSRAKLSGVNLTGTNLRGTNLNRAEFISANLTQADLSGADLLLVNLSRANLFGANLSGTNLSGTNLNGARLNNANFERATLRGTIFGDVDLSSCSGLDTVKHQGPSTLGIDSIIHSKGRIPETFLRGIGLPDEWITYIPSLVGDGIQFFSCFISYSSADKPFAVRLYNALQAKGIRCWLDEKQLLPGHDISREVEHGINSWDKFLLCASKNSLTSPWVEEEIATTLERERKLRNERGKKVFKLIPLNLDGYMFTEQWDLGTHAREIRSRVAADFQGWETNKERFDAQVDRVIKALRADEGAREKSPPSRL